MAGVNKALIYYYFESKDSLLEELVNRVLKELIAEKKQVFDVNPTLKGYVDEVMRRGIEITEKRMPILSVLCMEAMKSEERQTALLQVFDRLLEESTPIAEKLGFKKGLMDQDRMPGFFFGFAPLFLYQILKDKWADHYKVDKKKMENDFMRFFTNSYFTIITRLMEERGKLECRRGGNERDSSARRCAHSSCHV